MKITSLSIPDVKLIEPDVFGDDRGFFMKLGRRHLFLMLESIFSLFRTTFRALIKECFVVFIIKYRILRANWFGALEVRSLM